MDGIVRVTKGESVGPSVGGRDTEGQDLRGSSVRDRGQLGDGAAWYGEREDEITRPPKADHKC